MVSAYLGDQAPVDQSISAFIGFPLPDDLYERMEALVLRLRDGEKAHQGALYAQVVLELVDESLATFFIRPVNDVDISPMGEKLVNAGVSSVKKAVSVLVTSLSKKLSNEEMLPLAEYLWTVIYTDLTRETPGENAFMASPIPVELDEELMAIVQAIESGETGPDIEERLVTTLLAVSEISLDMFFAQPLKMIKLGMMMRKASQMAFEATRAAIRGVIKKVFKGMEERELRGVAAYIRSVRFSKERFVAEAIVMTNESKSR